MKFMTILFLCLFSITVLNVVNAFNKVPPCAVTKQHITITKPLIQQGISYKNPVDISLYWVSEKLDGMRGYWDGTQLFSRQGHVIKAPKWFTKNWPNTALDGELWISRNTFQTLMSCVKRSPLHVNAKESCWHNVRFMVFDLPNSKRDFNHRVQIMKKMIQHNSSSYLGMIKQHRLSNSEELSTMFTGITSSFGEGVMLHLGSSFYLAGRTSDIIKLKKIEDAEARVIAHMAGKGKYKNMLGSLKVITGEGIVFKIGSGFSDKDRQNPPALGSIITFKYNGKTQAGVPRFARYFRPRVTMQTLP